MYAGLLHSHNAWRWVVVATVLVVLVRAGRAAFGGGSIGPKAALPMIVGFDVQLLIGLALWVVSPLTPMMPSVPTDHYFAYLHPLIMVVALVLVHFVHVQVRKKGASAKFLFQITCGIAVLTAAGIPWWRALAPGMG